MYSRLAWNLLSRPAGRKITKIHLPLPPKCCDYNVFVLCPPLTFTSCFSSYLVSEKTNFKAEFHQSDRHGQVPDSQLLPSCVSGTRLWSKSWTAGHVQLPHLHWRVLSVETSAFDTFIYLLNGNPVYSRFQLLRNNPRILPSKLFILLYVTRQVDASS